MRNGKLMKVTVNKDESDGEIGTISRDAGSRDWDVV